MSFFSGFSKTASIRVLKTLGRGGEGVAQVVKHPQYGTVVRKTYNIAGKLFSKPLFEKKLEILKKVKSPHLPKFYGQEGNKPITYHEYVKFKKERLNSTPEREKVIKELNKQVRSRTGTSIKDLYTSNLVKGKDGSYKAIDFLIDGPLSRTSRRGQLKHTLRTRGRSAMGKLLRSFDPEAIRHKSRKEILQNANLPKPQRDRLIDKATKAS